MKLITLTLILTMLNVLLCDLTFSIKRSNQDGFYLKQIDDITYKFSVDNNGTFTPDPEMPNNMNIPKIPNIKQVTFYQRAFSFIDPDTKVFHFYRPVDGINEVTGEEETTADVMESLKEHKKLSERRNRRHRRH
jgi:hypothetical protein